MIGEHIRALKGGRWNHAIDCGDETVIHLADDGTQSSRVRRSYRPEFIAGAQAVEVVRHRERTFPPNEVVARAYSRISDPGLAGTFRDSEAFADWCVTGRRSVGPMTHATSLSSVAVTAPPTAAAVPAHPRARVIAKGAATPAPARAEAKPGRSKPAKVARPARPARGKKARGTAKPKGRGKKVAKKIVRRAARRR